AFTQRAGRIRRYAYFVANQADDLCVRLGQGSFGFVQDHADCFGVRSDSCLSQVGTRVKRVGAGTFPGRNKTPADQPDEYEATGGDNDAHWREIEHSKSAQTVIGAKS